VNEYVNRIGQNLVRNSDAKVPFTIKVVDDDTINAFALPGGFFYVDSGLILAADDESELAGVMAHEIAHVCARHAMRQMTRGNIANLATIPLIFVGGGLGYGVRQAAGIGLPLTFMSFSRGFEAEADYLGTQYLYKTGYDPNGLVTMFEKIDALQKKKPGALSKAFASHPQTPDRIGKTQEEIAKILPARDQYVVTTSEFEQVKARLAAIENRRKLTDQKDDGKPSLRRANNDKDKKDKTGKSDDDDRATLKKGDDQLVRHAFDFIGEMAGFKRPTFLFPAVFRARSTRRCGWQIPLSGSFCYHSRNLPCTQIKGAELKLHE